jgi:hypothetical protein
MGLILKHQNPTPLKCFFLKSVKTFDDRKQLSIFDPAEEETFKKVTFSTGSLEEENES